MPSWNIHTAHAEHLLMGNVSEQLGIEDANAFLFGSYVPDIYVGFMVPDASFRIDYCITHHAKVSSIPLPDADRFWDAYIHKRRPQSGTGLSLVLGAWAHLVADRFYNGRFRVFCRENTQLKGDELRIRKQGDFDVFGHSLGISAKVKITASLVEAAWDYRPYCIHESDVARTVKVASTIVDETVAAGGRSYRLLNAEWMDEAFGSCNERIITWLQTWRRREAVGASCSAAEVRRHAGLPPATEDAGM
ncbi:MAG TPA: hypothetical protein DCP91_09825 [Eggerthellaceae bacterium]|nr:hypothetical protein [Eggerthellaceae bacterium]